MQSCPGSAQGKTLPIPLRRRRRDYSPNKIAQNDVRHLSAAVAARQQLRAESHPSEWLVPAEELRREAPLLIRVGCCSPAAPTLLQRKANPHPDKEGQRRKR